MKLTKEQVKSLAIKIERELADAREAKIQAGINSIIKQDKYKQLVQVLNSREKRTKELQHIDDFLSQKLEELNIHIFHSNYSKEDVFRKILETNKMISLRKSYEDIYNDIILATIDQNLDVDKFIKEYLKKNL